MSYKSYWDARAKACEQFADEGECLAQVARHVPVTIGSYDLGALRARGAPRRRPAGSRGERTGRPQYGKMMRRARRAARRSGAISGGGRRRGLRARGRGRQWATTRTTNGSVSADVPRARRREAASGLGMTGLGVSAQDVLRETGRLIADPEGTLARRGPAIVAAADRHVINPMIDKATAGIMPYILKYIVPLMVVGYVGTGIAAFYSYKAAKKLNANKRRRRRRRTSR